MQVLVRPAATNEGSDPVDGVKPRDIGTLEMGNLLGAFAGQVREHKSGFARVSVKWHSACITALGTL
jgi:hypothetical protein